LTQLEDDQERVHDYFKAFFDERKFNAAQKKNPECIPPSHAEVRRYYKDFLRMLYATIRLFLWDNVRSWDAARVEFRFSVPNFWMRSDLSCQFKQLAEAAGFGNDGPNHMVDVSLSEAEAIACHTFAVQGARFSVSPF
jgi:hypothetical protein